MIERIKPKAFVRAVWMARKPEDEKTVPLLELKDPYV